MHTYIELLCPTYQVNQNRKKSMFFRPMSQELLGSAAERVLNGAGLTV